MSNAGLPPQNANISIPPTHASPSQTRKRWKWSDRVTSIADWSVLAVGVAAIGVDVELLAGDATLLHAWPLGLDQFFITTISSGLVAAFAGVVAVIQRARARRGASWQAIAGGTLGLLAAVAALGMLIFLHVVGGFLLELGRSITGGTR